MKQGEKAVLALIALTVVAALVRSWWLRDHQVEKDRGIPFYITASADLTRKGSDLYREQHCRECHSLWTLRNMMESVPAPALDGIGSLRTEDWFYRYFSAPNPQAILPSRLKPEFRMPSYAALSDEDRHTLASYMSSLKVQDWYLADTRKAEYEKLTGKEYTPQ